MTFEEAKNELKEGFKERNYNLVDEHPNELFFKSDRVEMFKFTEEEIKNYQEICDSNYILDCKPFETSLVNQNYREQLIQFTHPIRSRFLNHREVTAIFGTENDSEIFVQIGNCSNIFILRKLFSESFFEIMTDRMRFRTRRNESISFSDLIYKPMTIKVNNMNESSIDNAVKKSNSIIDACLFSYTSQKNNPIGILEEWPNNRIIRKREFEYTERKIGHDFNLPKVNFNQNLVRFYQLASSTDIESYKFLSYYHIIEYHFLTISDKILYDRLSRRINDLKFKTMT